MFTPKISISIKGNPHLDKQTTFGLATTLTEVAVRARRGSIAAIEKNFTIRTNWDTSGPFQVKIKPATKQSLTATMGTAADWLGKFLRGEPGGIVVNLPQGKFLAVPTTNVRRSKRDVIRNGQRPRDFMGKRDVLLPMRSGKGFVLFQRVSGTSRRKFFGSRRGGSSDLVAMYILTPAAKIRQRDLLEGPARQVIEQHWASIFDEKLKKAFATAR
jgi:hypothetical protein